MLHVSNNRGLPRETLLLLYLVKHGSKMSQFKPEQFLSEPDKEIFYELRKDDLICLGKHLELAVKGSMHKSEIQNVIMNHLVSTKVFKEYDVKNNEMMDMEFMKFKLELEFIYYESFQQNFLFWRGEVLHDSCHVPRTF